MGRHAGDVAMGQRSRLARQPTMTSLRGACHERAALVGRRDAGGPRSVWRGPQAHAVDVRGRDHHAMRANAAGLHHNDLGVRDQVAL